MSIDISAITGTQTSMYTGSTTSTAAKQDLDSESFMNLLVAQLKYQDPSSPMDTNEIMSQTTQLASVEKLNTIATTMSESFALQMRTAAADLVGREVSYLTTDGEYITGIVDAVRYAGEVPTVVIGDTEIPLDSVAQVTQATSAVTEPEETTPEPATGSTADSANSADSADSADLAASEGTTV